MLARAQKKMDPMVYLIRDRVSEINYQGRFGKFIIPFADLEIQTIELPWRDNRNSISCIPTGTYKLTPWSSAKYGKCWHVNDVPNRTAILIHKGNVAGAKDMGYRTDSSGCIIVGKSRGVLHNQMAVLNSGGAKALLDSALGHEQSYTLVVSEV